MKKLKENILYLPILLFVALFAGCSDNDDEFIEDSPYHFRSCIRLDIYNADGTEYDITPLIEQNTKVCVINPDNKILGLSGTESSKIIKGNSIYTPILYMSNEYREFWNNIPFTITLNSPEMFNDNEDCSISLAFDGDKFVNIDPYQRYPNGYIIKVESEDLDIYCDREFVEDDYDPYELGKVLPIRVTLSANGGD